MSISFLTKDAIPKSEEVYGYDMRDSIFNFITQKYPDFTRDNCISILEMNKLRREYLTTLIQQEKGEMAILDADVLEAIKNNSILSEKIQYNRDPIPTLGQQVADKVASFGGSWTFIIIFLSFILVWMIINIIIFANKGFDPYPFILLNLILSCIAAIQAPIIMMSQNRQEEKDRERAEEDFKINMKAELEIKLLSEKIDHLLVNQNRKLLEIQEVQADFLEDLMKQIKKM